MVRKTRKSEAIREGSFQNTWSWVGPLKENGIWKREKETRNILG